MASSPNFSSHQAKCEDIWPFDELIADGEMDPADRMASFELSKTDELDRCKSFEQESKVLRMIRKWLNSPLATPPCDSVDSRLSTMPSYASVDFVMPVKPSYDLAKSRPPPKPNYPAWKPRPTPKPNYHHS